MQGYDTWSLDGLTMSSLLSVMFVASSASGPRLLFTYPPNPTATPRVQRPLYGKTSAVRDAQLRSSGDQTSTSSSDSEDDGEDMFGARFIRGESSSSSEDEDEELHDEYATREQRELDTYTNYLGINTNVLGNLLCPGKQLCNKRFEMVINHLAYIAHPASARVSLSHTNYEPGSSRPSRGGDKHSAFESDGESDEFEDSAGMRRDRLDTMQFQSANETPARGRSASTTAFNSRRTSGSLHSRPSNIRTSRESSATHRQSQTSQGPPPSIFPSDNSQDASPLVPFKDKTVSPASMATLSNTLPYSSISTSSLSAPSAQPSSALSTVSELDVWAVVLVIDSPPDQHLSFHLGVYYRDVIVPVMAGLKYEERRNGYVTEQAAKIAALRDKAVDMGELAYRVEL